MRPIHCLLFVFTVLVSSTRGDELPQIPNGSEKAKKILASERAATMAVTWEAYQKVGRRNAKWDKLVELAMKANADVAYGSRWDQPIARGG